MHPYLKFLRKLPRKLRDKLILTIDLILINKLEGLDIKKLVGLDSCYRCRVGKIRIVFIVTSSGNKILEITFRGGSYK
jgi:mRNA-degrading endonuclease RelE of RelBE toxin-antitoxin system